MTGTLVVPSDGTNPSLKIQATNSTYAPFLGFYHKNGHLGCGIFAYENCRKFAFRSYSSLGTYDAYENFFLPSPSATNSRPDYSILTTKSLVTVPQGGTGAGTAAGARTNLGLGAVATENTVPITKGGTGAITAEEALANLGAVGISKFKNLAYSQTDARGEIANTTISAYPTTPGVFRVGDNNATLGIPESRGTLIIFDGGGFIGHIFVNSNGLWFAKTDGTYTVTAWTRVQDWLFSDSNGTFIDKYGRNWNPEFVFGAEYITEERWNNIGVYKKWFNLGKLGAAGSTISVSHGITRTWITGVRGIAVIPGGSALEMVNGGNNGSVFVSDDKIQWYCAIDLSSYNGYVEITYTKV